MTNSILQPLIDFTFPPHCLRRPAHFGIFAYPWPILFLQSYLLLHAPSRSSNPCLDKHARLIRMLLVLPEVILCLHMGYAYRFYHVRNFVYNEQDLSFVSAIFALHAISKTLWLAYPTTQPALAKSYDKVRDGDDKNADGNQDDTNKTVTSQRLPRPAYFPHTRIPLFIDLVTNLRGLGWDWGIRSKAGYGSLPPMTLPDPRTKSFLKSRLRICVYCYFTCDFGDNMATRRHFLAAFDYPSGGLQEWSPPFAKSSFTIILVQMMLTILAGIVVLAPIQGVFSFLSIVSTLISPKTQTWWDPLPFDSPYFATSLEELWGKRWHALFRRDWTSCGYYPAKRLAKIIGLGKDVSRLVAVFATFALSGLYHEAGQFAMRRSTAVDFAAKKTIDLHESRGPQGQCLDLSPGSTGFGAQGFVTLRFFLLQAVALFVEMTWRRVTGSKVASWWGWLWMVSWLGFWGRDVIKVWIHHGFVDGVGKTILTEKLAEMLVEGVVKIGNTMQSLLPWV